MKITIIGFGLMGGSLGMALMKRGYRVTAVDKDKDALDMGLKMGAAAEITEDVLVGIRDAQVVFVATPLKAAEAILRQIAPHLRPGVIVTDLGSAKTSLTQVAEEVLPNNVDFIGGHPMAGKEQAGIAGADPLLLLNAFYVLTPGSSCSRSALEILSNLAKHIGAVPIIMDTLKHDRAVAVVSHLPHLVAVALAQTAGRLEEKESGCLSLAAGSFRDGTRVAESSPQMWSEICLANRPMILESIGEFRETLDRLERALHQNDGEAIIAEFEAAGKTRALYHKHNRARVFDLVELAVSVPDAPGSLGLITKALGENNINIINIEILRGREGLPGSVVLGVRGHEAAELAGKVIRELGFPVELS